LRICYLNTDLDLASTVDLEPLAAVFESQGVSPLLVMKHDDGHWFARFETDEQYKEPESSIAAILSVIDRFDVPEQNIWKTLTLCEFNIGYNCGSEPWAFNQGLSNELLQRMAKVGASLKVTLYSPESLKDESQQTQSSESLIEDIEEL
jgi:hypothetical protein